MTKRLQPPARIAVSLMALKLELEREQAGKSGEGANILMKINSCLYSEYPSREHPADVRFIMDMLPLSDIPRDKSFPADAMQCDECGGHGCKTCDNKGWVPKGSIWGRTCFRNGCGKPIPPGQVAVYCSDECAFADAQPNPKRETLFIREFEDHCERSFEIVEETGSLLVLRELKTAKLYDFFVPLSLAKVIDELKQARKVESAVGFKLTAQALAGTNSMRWVAI